MAEKATVGSVSLENVKLFLHLTAEEFDATSVPLHPSLNRTHPGEDGIWPFFSLFT